MFLVDSNTLIYASKEPNSFTAAWINQPEVFVCSLSYDECLINWPAIDYPTHHAQKRYLSRLFTQKQQSGLYINCSLFSEIIKRATYLSQKPFPNIKPNDAILAATAEHYGLILVTADLRRDFTPRLTQLNQQGQGRFLFQTYDYQHRETTFARWLNEIN